MNRLEEKFKREAETKGYTVLGNGWPDYLIMKGNRYIAVEVKSANDALKDNQVEMLKAIQEAGIKCCVYRELETEPTKAVLIPLNEILVDRENRIKTNFENTWEEGIGHLFSAIKNLKEIGLNDETITLHMNRLLSNWGGHDID